METALKGAESLATRIGTYARLVIVGVWFPGFILFCELGYLYFIYTRPTDKPFLTYAAEKLREFDSDVITAFIVLFIFAASVIIGYISRDLSFAVSDFWLRRGWSPTRKLADILAQIRSVYGKNAVDEITTKYSVFSLAEIAGGGGGLALPRQPEVYVREFSKLWLRTKAPNLATDGLEVEINMVMGLVLPTALASLVCFTVLTSLLGFILGIASIMSAAIIFYRVNWARNIETEQTIVNFLFAHWENLAAPVSAPAGPGDREP